MHASPRVEQEHQEALVNSHSLNDPKRKQALALQAAIAALEARIRHVVLLRMNARDDPLGIVADLPHVREVNL